MLKKYFPFFFLIYSSVAFAQAPVFNWGASAGGSDDDIIYDIAIPDSTIFQCTIGCPLTLVGSTKSDDGNLTNCNSLIAGNFQALVLKFTTFGNFNDCFSFGGSGSDKFHKVQYHNSSGFATQISSIRVTNADELGSWKLRKEIEKLIVTRLSSTGSEQQLRTQ